MIKPCLDNLSQLKDLLKHLNDNDFTTQLAVFNGSSLGQHYRHIIEIYQCLIFHKAEVICYDDRKRNYQMETDSTYCFEQIENLCQKIENLTFENKTIKISTFCGTLESSFERELLYVLEHSIHHQALIKIGLRELGKEELISKSFGLAASTIKFNEECAR